LITRLATFADAAAITRIYNQGIEERVATFETEPRTVQQVEAILAEKGDHHPAVVVERDGEVIAFAWASSYRNRPCYTGIAEHSVYVDRDARGLGAGLIALNALSDAFAEHGYWKLLSRIFPENTASLKLHERAGFRVVGTYHRHAKLDGEWRDTVIVEKLLGEAAREQ
jgi:L-amino acid N-acyltransferase YncA